MGMPLIERRVFAHHVRDALANLYDPIHLQTHPLINLLGLQPAAGQTTGVSLRQLLRETISSLKPAVSLPADHPQWLSYRILWLLYVQSRDRAEVTQDLGLSQASFYRYKRQALDAVISLLWEQYVRTVASPASETEEPATLPDFEQAKEEAVRLARATRRQSVDLRAVLHGFIQTILPLANRQGVHLQIDVPDTLPVVYGDPAILRQIFLNILAEGIQCVTAGSLWLAMQTNQEETIWSLCGQGIASSCAGDPTQARGFALSRELLGVYGGRLWFEVREKGGACLRFTVPAAKPKSILIIDDDTDTILLYRRYLQSQGHAVNIARSGEEIQAVLAESRPDLIVLDVLMPQQDGWEILQRLKTAPETADIPVVICSVLGQPHLALALGAADVLKKPVTQEALLQSVQSFLA